MKNIFTFLKSNRVGFVSLLLLVFALACGASFDIAMAADTTGALADDKGIASDLPGTVASAGQIREGELAEPEVDGLIAKFRPYKFPLDTDIRKEARQSSATGYEIEHYASGSSILDCVTNAALAKTASNTASLPVASTNYSMFPKYATIVVPEVAGYNAAGNAVDGSLMLFVTASSDSGVTVEAVNPVDESGTKKIPAIPSGSKLIVCANACSESQMIVAPENYQPRPKTVYLQKKITNIVLTDHWKEIAKKVPFVVEDVRDNALYNHRRKCARTAWIGRQYKVKKQVSDTMGEEYIYFSEGVIRQVQSLYAYLDKVSYEELIAICKMQFTEYSVNNQANVYCGKNFMERLLNIDFTKHKDITFTANTVLGVDIKAFKTTFGTLNFKWDPTLDDVGYSDFACVLDIQNAVRYVKVDNKEQHVDMKKGAGENREATRDIYSQIDCIALKGFNSILIGPSNAIIPASDKTVNSTWATSVSVLPTENLTDGMKVYLTTAIGAFPAGSILYWDLASESWKEYSGIVDAA
jgi:hypothetical protein